MLILALALAWQDVPKPTPGICSDAAFYVETISTSEELARGRYMTAEQEEAGERRKAELSTLAKALTVRFGKVRASATDRQVFPSLTAVQMEALARACLALPK